MRTGHTTADEGARRPECRNHVKGALSPECSLHAEGALVRGVLPSRERSTPVAVPPPREAEVGRLTVGDVERAKLPSNLKRWRRLSASRLRVAALTGRALRRRELERRLQKIVGPRSAGTCGPYHHLPEEWEGRITRGATHRRPKWSVQLIVDPAEVRALSRHLLAA